MSTGLKFRLSTIPLPVLVETGSFLRKTWLCEPYYQKHDQNEDVEELRIGTMIAMGGNRLPNAAVSILQLCQRIL
jgi:hypothetical protein